MRRLLLLAALATAVGCSPAKTDDDTGEDGTDGSGDAGGSDGGSSTSPDAPTIEAFDSWCYQHTTGDKAYFWVATATADDPQGADTIESFFEGITVLSGETELAKYYFSCSSDGECAGSWNENQDGIACGNASSYTIRAEILDDEGNWSAPASVSGKECSSSGGC